MCSELIGIIANREGIAAISSCESSQANGAESKARETHVPPRGEV
jgi:hypothetical protein